MKTGKKLLALLLALSLAVGYGGNLPTSYAEENAEATYNETLLLSDSFDVGTSWATGNGKWRVYNAQFAGPRNGTAPLGYDTKSARNLYNDMVTDIHLTADVCVTSAVNANDGEQYHFLLARASEATAAGGVGFGLRTINDSTESTLVIYTNFLQEAQTKIFETTTKYPFGTILKLELFIVESLVVAKCNGETIFANTVEGISSTGYCGIVDRSASSAEDANCTKGGYFDNFALSTITYDGFRVNGSVVADKTGNGVADISILSGDLEVTDMEDVAVTVSSDQQAALRYIDLRDESAITLHGLCMDENSETFSRMDTDVALEIAGENTAFSKTSVYTHARESAGGRMRFSTNSSVISIKAGFPSYVADYAGAMEAGKTGFDVYIDTDEGSAYYGTISPTNSELPTEDKAWSYEGQVEFGTEETRNITIYFPITNEVSDVSVGVEADAVVEANSIPYADADPIVYYGSSITQGGNATRPGLTYVNTIGRMLGREYLDLGVWGSAAGQREFAEYIAGLDMSVFVFDYDHNASSAEHLENTHYAFYEIVRSAHKDIPIIFITRPNQNADWKGHKAVIYGNYEKAVAAGDKKVYFIDGQTFFKGETGCLSDGVHPSDKGHGLMAASIGGQLAEILSIQAKGANLEVDKSTSEPKQENYYITLKEELPITNKTATASKVYVVSNLTDAVTSMTDSRWTGNTTDSEEKFTVDASGKATVVGGGSADNNLSVLNVGQNNGKYSNFYIEYTLTMPEIPAEKRVNYTNWFIMGDYGDTTASALEGRLFFDTRASQAPNKTFWARLMTVDKSFSTSYSEKIADEGIGGGIPMTLGMLVYDNAVIMFINGEEVCTYPGTQKCEGWFGIWNGSGNATVENFIYVPLTKEVTEVEFIYPDTIMMGETPEISVVPTYSWPYGKGAETTEGISVSGLDNTKYGPQNLTISYEGISKDVEIEVVNYKTVVSEDFITNPFSDKEVWNSCSNVTVRNGVAYMPNNANASAYICETISDGFIEATISLDEPNDKWKSAASSTSIYPATLSCKKTVGQTPEGADITTELRVRFKITKGASEEEYTVQVETLIVPANSDTYADPTYANRVNLTDFEWGKDYTLRLSFVGNYVETSINGVVKVQRTVPETLVKGEADGTISFSNSVNNNGCVAVTLDDLKIGRYETYTITTTDEKITLPSYSDFANQVTCVRDEFAMGEDVVVAVNPSEGEQLSATAGLYYTVGNADTKYSVSQRLYGAGEKREISNQFVLKMPASDITLTSNYYQVGNKDGTANIGIKGVSIREESDTQEAALRFSSRGYKNYTDESGKTYQLKSMGTLLFRRDLGVDINDTVLENCYNSEGTYKNENDITIGKKVTATYAQDICDDFIDWGLYLTYNTDSTLWEAKYTVYSYAVYEANGETVVKFSKTPITYSYNEVADIVGYSER